MSYYHNSRQSFLQQGIFLSPNSGHDSLVEGKQMSHETATPNSERVKKAYGQELDILFNISLKHRYLFIQNPKVGSTSLKYCLHTLALEGTPAPQKAPRHPRITESPLVKPYQLPLEMFETTLTSDDYLRFCFVRNPYSRILSCYLDKIAQRRQEAKIFYRQMGLNLEQDISFSTFIDLLHEHRAERGKWNRHWRPQSRILKPHIINYTLIGKFEQFEQDFERLNSYLDGVLPALVQRAPHKTQAQDRIAHFYTPALKQKVEEIYAKDFEGFGYQYNLTQTITKRPD